MKPPEEPGAPAPETVKTVTAGELLIDLPPAPPSPPKPAAPPAPDAEKDSLGRPFDAGKFRPEKDSLGRWKNLNAGRRAKSAGTAPAASLPPVPEVGPDDAPPPAAGAPPAADPGAGHTPPPPAGGDATLSPDAGGNLLARVLYGVTGFLTGDRKAATARGDEHKAISSTFAAFLSFRGIALVGSLALVATVVCYLLDENRGDSIGDALKRRFAKRPGDGAKRAEPTAAPQTVQPAARPAPAPSAPIDFPL